MEPAPEVVAGVSLAQYAAVMAAIAEPFALDEVLGVEELDPEGWSEAELGWMEKLATDAELLARYQVELAAAEDRLSRSVDPLDDDLGAWLAFLDAYAASPGDLLEKNGLGLNDLARLRRRWEQRMRDDPALSKRAADLKKKGPGKLPPVRTSKATLARSARPVDPRPGGESAADQKPQADDRDVRWLRAHRERILAAGARPAPAMPPPPVMSAPKAPVASPDIDDPETGLVDDLRPPTLPFRPTPSPEYLEALRRPGAAPGEGSDGATKTIPTAGMALPEVLDDEPTTTGVVEVASIAREPLPFGAKRDVDASEETTRVMPRRAEVQPRFDHRGVWAAVDLGALEGAKEKDAGDDEQTRTVVVASVRQKPLPFVEPADEVPPASSPAPVLEPAADEPMSLERHASLCVELALDVGRSDEVLARYQVSAAGKERADRHYKALMAQDPALRAAWNRAFEIYRAWYVMQPR